MARPSVVGAALICGLVLLNGASATRACGQGLYVGALDGRLLRGRVDGGGVADHDVREVSVGSTIAIASNAGKLYWIDESSDRLYRSDLDGSHIAILRCDGIDHPKSLTVSEQLGKIFWTEYEAGEVRTTDLDGRYLASPYGNLPKPFGVSVDSWKGQLYVTGSWTPKGVARIDLAGSTFEVLPAAGAVLPRAVAASPAINSIFWVDNAKVRRSTLDGFNVQTLPLWVKPDTALAVDPFRNRLFRISQLWTLIMSRTDGTEASMLPFAPPGLIRGLVVAVASGHLFLTQPSTGIWRVDVDEGTSTPVIEPSSPDGPIWAMDVDESHGRVFWVEPTSEGNRLVSTGAQGEARQATSIPSDGTVFDIHVEPLEETVYLSEMGGVSRVSFDGSGYTPVFGLPHFATGFDRHAATGEWYWIGAEQLIFRGNADGSVQELFGFVDGLADDLAIDVEENRLYWLEFVPDGRLMRTDMSSFDPEVVLDGISAGSRLQFDEKNRVMYWSDLTQGLWRWSMGDEAPVHIDVPTSVAGFAVGLVVDAPADLTRDGVVNQNDLGAMLKAWGDCGCAAPCLGDLNGDGAVDGRDVGVMLGAWTST